MNGEFTPGHDGASIEDNVRQIADKVHDETEGALGEKITAPPAPPQTPGIGLPETLGGYGSIEEWREASAERYRRNAITGSIVVFTLAIAAALYSLAWQASLVWIALVAIVAAIELTND